MTTPNKSTLGVLMLGAIGVVFGDIGTSPLYAFREVFADGRVPFSHDHVLSATSMFIWADRKSTRLNSSHLKLSRMPSSA